MGINIMTNCCSGQLSSQDKKEKKYLSSIEENYTKEINYINKIPEIKDLNQFVNYINSNECFLIVSKISSRTIFVKKLCKQIAPKEIINFIKNTIQFILSYNKDNNDKETIKYISMIKSYTKLGTKKIVVEFNIFEDLIKKEDENFLLRSLSDWVMLVLLMRYLNNKDEINLWINKNIDKLIKNYCFDGCYFLIKIKKKYIPNNINNKISQEKIFPTQNNYSINDEIKNEIKKMGNLVEDFINELIESNYY